MISKMASIENKLISQDAIFVSNWIMLDLRFAWFKIMILTLIIKRGMGIRILKHIPIRHVETRCAFLWVNPLWTWPRY